MDIFLHIGLHKTGSTSIQQTLFADKNNAILENRGIVYPKCWESNHSVPIYSAFCDNPEEFHVNINRGYSLEDIQEINSNNLQKLSDLVQDKNPSKLILSGEETSILTQENLHHLKEYLYSLQSNVNIQVVVFVRDPISWYVSNIQEWIKGGSTLEHILSGINTSPKKPFRSRIEKFIHVFGKDNLKVISLEKAVEHKHGLIGHFLTNIGVDDETVEELDILKSNESMSMASVNILSYINRHVPLYQGGKLNEKRSSEDYRSLGFIGGKRFDIPREYKQKLSESFKQDYDWIYDCFGIYYNKDDFKDTYVEVEFTEEISKGIILSYQKSTDTFKELILRYLQYYFPILDKESQELVNEILLRLGVVVDPVIRISEVLEIKRDKAEIYKEIAVFMESHGEIAAAKTMMEKALEFRPQGGFIKKKISEYNNLK